MEIGVKVQMEIFFIKIILMQPKLILNSERFHNGDITNPNIFEAVAEGDLGLLLHPRWSAL